MLTKNVRSPFFAEQNSSFKEDSGLLGFTYDFRTRKDLTSFNFTITNTADLLDTIKFNNLEV
jgi:hypothetical protein